MQQILPIYLPMYGIFVGHRQRRAEDCSKKPFRRPRRISKTGLIFGKRSTIHGMLDNEYGRREIIETLLNKAENYPRAPSVSAGNRIR
jgi:hypothetical protein